MLGSFGSGTDELTISSVVGAGAVAVRLRGDRRVVEPLLLRGSG